MAHALPGHRRHLFSALGLTALLGSSLAACFGVRPYPGPEPCAGVADCDDGSPCTIDFCGADGVCDHTPNETAAVADGLACTTDSCVGGVESHVPFAAGQQCGDGAGTGLECNATGACTGCEIDQQCGDDSACRTWTCGDDGTCTFASAAAGTACNNGGTCTAEGRCASCSDGLQNNGETDIDCGGPCVALATPLTCALDEHCDLDTDCASQRCEDHVCLVIGL